MRRRHLSLALALWPAAHAAPAVVLDAPNVVPISDRLVTSGQPTAAALARLADLGFGAVVHLAPADARDAVPDEAAIVQRQGLAYVHQPVRFEAPTAADLDRFNATLAGLADRKVLVHCQINLRASSMVFLHRATVGREPPDAAYAAVAGVWSPDAVWKAFIEAQLRRHGIDFETY